MREDSRIPHKATMKAIHPKRNVFRSCCAILLWVLAGLSRASGQPVQYPSPGERIYRDGILPTGLPMRAQGPGEAVVKGTTFACAGCHLTAGLGNSDERLVTPPVNGARLFSPSFRYFPFLTGAERADLPEVARDALRRPAYTEATLITAIRDGVDSAGHVLSPAMPRYPLDDHEAELLVGYLKGLSAVLSPGVSPTTLRFATVITEGVPGGDRDAMLAVMRKQLAIHNQVYEKNRHKVNQLAAMKEMTLPLRKWDLSVWELKGPPNTWRSQLEEHDRAEPVFALVGGISNGDWRPVHEFCQDRRLPCILPLTEHPFHAPAGSYTLYFSGGFYQEGATAGDHAAETLEAQGACPVIQVIQDTAAGRALARGFREALALRGREVQEVPAPAGNLPGPFLAKLLAGSHGKAVLALWGGQEVLAALAQAATGADQPGLLLMSASLLKEALWELPQDARPFTLLTYPYRFPKPPSLNQDPRNLAPVPAIAAAIEPRVRSRTYALMQVMDEGIRGMGRDFYRENFLDRIGLMDDKTDSDYQVLKFSPGQPWLSPDCNLVRVPKGSLHTFSTGGL